MLKTLPVTHITKWIKLFTYISATVLLMSNNHFNQLTYLIPLLILIFFVNYSREYYLVYRQKPIQYIWMSIGLELLLIISIGLIDQHDINLLLMYIFISNTTIVHPISYSVLSIGGYFISLFSIYAVNNGLKDLMRSIIPMSFNYGVPIAFVVGMSYLVKVQIQEKEKLGNMNRELEEAYKKLIKQSAIAQKLSVEEERTRMAREIHDTLAHTLTTLTIQLEACKKLASLDPSRLLTELEKAQTLSRSGFNEVKHSIKALRPIIMEEKSFIASITAMVRETMDNTGIHITFNNLLPDHIKLHPKVEITLYRVIQESITNAIRHGQCEAMTISLQQDEDMIQLEVTDNGLGCVNITHGYGMQGIQERIERLEGKVGFWSAKGKGFKLKASIPNEQVKNDN